MILNAREDWIIRISLALIWIITGIISMGIHPVEESLNLLKRVGIEGQFGLWTLYGEALLDIGLGVLTLMAPDKTLWLFQILVVGVYTLVITFFLPEFWLHPFGPLLKNLPIFTLLWLLYKNEGMTP